MNQKTTIAVIVLATILAASTVVMALPWESAEASRESRGGDARGGRGGDAEGGDGGEAESGDADASAEAGDFEGDGNNNVGSTAVGGSATSGTATGGTGGTATGGTDSSTGP